MNLFFSKVYLFFLLIVCRLVSGLSPLFISHKVKKKHAFSRISKSRVEKGVSYSMDFSGGILLATTFIHMIPEVREHLSEVLDDKYVFPFAETLVCIGFFTVYVLEELVKNVLLDKTQLREKTNVLITVQDTEPRLIEAFPMSAKVQCENEEDHVACLNSSVQMASINKLSAEVNEKNNNTKNLANNNLKHLLLVSALSFHSVMEGLAIGLATNVQDLWYLFLAVMLHECTILLCVGIELVANCANTAAVIKYIVVLALVSPAGVVVGTVITMVVADAEGSSLKMVFVHVLQGLAAGTILYVTFFEVLNNHKHHHSHPQAGRKHHHDHHSESGLPKLAFIAVGFAFMICLELMSGHEMYHAHHMNTSSTNCGNNTS